MELGPKIAGQLHAYKSITIWQGDPEWEIHVAIDGFSTLQLAAEFGQKAKSLKQAQNIEYLVLTDGEGNHHKVEQHQVMVAKLKQCSQDKLVVCGNDFEPVDISIKDFPSIEGLDRGFESLAYVFYSFFS